MTKETRLQGLKFEPKNQILTARFTQTEATKIRQFCTEEQIPLSRIIRHAFQQIIPNL